MKTLVNDGMEKEGIVLLEQAGIAVDTRKRDKKSLLKEMGNFDALIVRSATKVTKDIIQEGSKGLLKIIGRAGVGYDNIDVRSASKQGVVVKFAPYGNTNAAAELTLGLMLAVSRNLPQSCSSLQKGEWKKKPFLGTELSKKTLGIIGCGRIGQRLAELVQGFPMEVIGYDPFINKDSRIKYLSKEEVLRNADYVSVHANANHPVIGEKEIALMKKTAYLINVARGCTVDEKALYSALKKRNIAGAALDVYTHEPKEEGAFFQNPLGKLENVVLSSHLGASTLEAQEKTSIEIAKVVSDYLLKGDFSNAVNAGETVDAEQKLLFPLFLYHADIPGAFAKIDKVLAEYKINIRENSSRQLGKGGMVMTVYLVHQPIQEEVLRALRQLKIMYSAKA